MKFHYLTTDNNSNTKCKMQHICVKFKTQLLSRCSFVAQIRARQNTGVIRHFLCLVTSVFVSHTRPLCSHFLEIFRGNSRSPQHTYNAGMSFAFNIGKRIQTYYVPNSPLSPRTARNRLTAFYHQMSQYRYFPSQSREFPSALLLNWCLFLCALSAIRNSVFCLKLGKTVSKERKCCSGFSVNALWRTHS